MSPRDPVCSQTGSTVLLRIGARSSARLCAVSVSNLTACGERRVDEEVIEIPFLLVFARLAVAADRRMLTCLSHFMGSKPSTGEAIVAGTLDVATMLVQIVVLGPMIAKECIDANTDDAAEKRATEDGDRIFVMFHKTAKLIYFPRKIRRRN